MAQNDMLGMFFQLLPKVLGMTGTGGNTVNYNSKDQALMEVKGKAGSITVVLGTRETGCTTLCLRIAELFARPTFIISPQETPPAWAKPVTLSQALSGMIPEHSTLILDDLAVYMGNRDYSDADVKKMEKAIPMVRHDKHPPDYPIGKTHMIFRTQSAAQADKYILDCDLAFFKPLGLLTNDMERPSIARLYRKEINPYFAGKNTEFVRKHAYMMHQSYRGLITVSKPTNEGHEMAYHPGQQPEGAPPPRSAPSETIIIE